MLICLSEVLEQVERLGRADSLHLDLLMILYWSKLDGRGGTPPRKSSFGARRVAGGQSNFGANHTGSTTVDLSWSNGNFAYRRNGKIPSIREAII